MENNRDTMCFGCGKDNPMGLHLHFRTDENGCYTSFVPQPVHQSYDGRMHGGLISTLLDETMGNYPYMYEHKVAYTARLEVRFRQPVRIGERIDVITKVKRRKGMLLEMTGQVIREDGTVAAEADGKLMYEERA
ncbi:PaaI family thioesterase [Acidaminococcus fermentans]|uniref:Acyl-coenzyme A thioesterase THEM4 n=2 Tax=Acidaminococcus fermentans TaxID=905 RepID=D2RJU4_ACIFV|nr:hotdog fold domain-containing protein [Acidaminococcus fermentans]ADB47346.1 thioesterase superfamily protein [Acidaminococcus fermentans DSM 20731]MCF0139595.1 PaaI family thioesterase [Acidaminococcus fermentans]MCI6285420.1 hotdog fold thioesterase [Acidaminococcus fermentans]MCI7193973.1 hotdog fold thioesterase [Acidaminococcus fermentans]MDD6288057.1 hotdog fold domain-containing protein [Acidaminococcus fermentans]